MDEVIINFGAPYYFWILKDDGEWVPFINVADLMVIGDIDSNGHDDVIVSFGDPFGIWTWMNNSSWVKLHNDPAQSMVTGNIDGLSSVAVQIDSAMGSESPPAELLNEATALPKVQVDE